MVNYYFGLHSFLGGSIFNLNSFLGVIMEIKLSDAQMNDIIDKVKSDLVKKSINEAKAKIQTFVNSSQFIAEVRNALVIQCADELRNKILADISKRGTIEKAVSKAEQRINDQINKKLINGITVKLGGVE